MPNARPQVYARDYNTDPPYVILVDAPEYPNDANECSDFCSCRDVSAAHPSLAAHDALGLATDVELQAHVDAANPHPNYATDIELAAHTGAADPHTQYALATEVLDTPYLVTTASGDISAEVVVGTIPGGELGGSWGTPTVKASHSGSTHAAIQAAAESTAASGTSTAVSNHEAALDPHTGYLKESDANYVDLTDGGATTLHTHAAGSERAAASTAPAAIGTAAVGVGVTDARADHVHAHGAGTPSTQAFGDAAVVGTAVAAAASDHKHTMPANPVTGHESAPDPHTGYRLESADHSHATTGLQGGTVAHSALSGISATDHHAAALAGPDANDTVDVAGAAGTAGTFARSGHGHQVATSASVASTQAFGDAATAGTAGAIQRGDHKHAMPANPVTAHEAAADPHTGYLKENDANYVDLTDGGATTLHSHTGGSERAAASTAPAAIGTAAVGVGVTDARADHVHAHGATTPSTQAFGDAAAVGTAVTAAASDHKHAMMAAPAAERLAASTAPAAIGTAAVGVGATDARADHVHAHGATTPSTQAFGDAAAIGTAVVAAAADHKHAMPGAAVLTNASVATQQIIAATTAYLTDSRIAVPSTLLRIRSIFTWKIHIDKTAAGSATSALVFLVKIGTAGSNADATVLTFTFPATQTAAIDDGEVDIEVVIRGPLSASCIAVGSLRMTHNLQTTGFANIAGVSLKAVSGVFNATTAGLFVGLSATTGAATVVNFQQVTVTTAGL